MKTLAADFSAGQKFAKTLAVIRMLTHKKYLNTIFNFKSF